MKNLVEELSEIYSRKSFDSLSSTPKKIYKSVLVEIFSNRLLPEYHPWKEKKLRENLMLLKDIKSNPKRYKNEEIYNQYFKKVSSISIKLGLRNRHSTEFENKIIAFMRDLLTKIRTEGRGLVTFKDISIFIELDKIFKDVYGSPHIKILPHHWIEFDITRGLIPTYPDFIVYGQQLYLWNVYMDKYQEYLRLKERGSLVSVDIKNVKYELDSLHTSLIVKSVTFVEAYLYFLYFNLSKSEVELRTEQAKGLLKVQRNVQDTDVIEKIVIGEYHQEVSDLELKKFKIKFQEYKRIVNVRDRLIHASAFEKSKDNHLIYLVTGNDEELRRILNFNTNFVLEIEKCLPETVKSLFWWELENIQHPDYLNDQKGSLAVEQGFSV